MDISNLPTDLKVKTLVEVCIDEVQETIRREGLFSELQRGLEQFKTAKLLNLKEETFHVFTTSYPLASLLKAATEIAKLPHEEVVNEFKGDTRLDEEFQVILEKLLKVSEVQILEKLSAAASSVSNIHHIHHNIPLTALSKLLPILNTDKYLVLLGDGPLLSLWLEKAEGINGTELLEGKFKNCRTDYYRYPTLKVLPDNCVLIIDRSAVSIYEQRLEQDLTEIVYDHALEITDPSGINFYYYESDEAVKASEPCWESEIVDTGTLKVSE